MRILLFDGVDWLYTFLDADENCIYYCGDKLWDPYNMRFATTFMAKAFEEYREWLPER